MKKTEGASVKQEYEVIVLETGEVLEKYDKLYDALDAIEKAAKNLNTECCITGNVELHDLFVSGYITMEVYEHLLRINDED